MFGFSLEYLTAESAEDAEKKIKKVSFLLGLQKAKETEKNSWNPKELTVFLIL